MEIGDAVFDKVISIGGAALAVWLGHIASAAKNEERVDTLRAEIKILREGQTVLVNKLQTTSSEVAMASSKLNSVDADISGLTNTSTLHSTALATLQTTQSFQERMLAEMRNDLKELLRLIRGGSISQAHPTNRH